MSAPSQNVSCALTRHIVQKHNIKVEISFLIVILSYDAKIGKKVVFLFYYLQKKYASLYSFAIYSA